MNPHSADDQFTNGDLLMTLDALLASPTFERESADDLAWRATFVELISQTNRLLIKLDRQGHRIDFMQNVGVNGKLQDITSLVNWMNRHLPELAADRAGQWAQNRLNRYFDEGWGRFANGYSFEGEFDGDLAFFIDDQRIYLNHHVRRAIDQARTHLSSIS